MFCPSCEGEYREGIGVCPVCEVDLIDEEQMRRLQARSEPDNSPAVTVFETTDLGMLELARSLLEREGIGCSVRNERMLGLFPSGMGTPGAAQPFRTAELQVTERNAEAARRVLEPLREPPPEQEPAED